MTSRSQYIQNPRKEELRGVIENEKFEFVSSNEITERAQIFQSRFWHNQDRPYHCEVQ